MSNSNQEDRIWEEIAANSNWNKDLPTVVQLDQSSRLAQGQGEGLPRPSFLKGTSLEGLPQGRILPVYERCGFCHDEGVIHGEGMRVELFDGQEVFIELKARRACPNCRLGLDKLVAWHASFPLDCRCDYGWTQDRQMVQKASGRIEEVTVLTTCPKCSEGSALRLEMDRLTFEKKQERLNKLVAGGGVTPEIAAMRFDNFNTGGKAKLEEVKTTVMRVAKLGEPLLLVGNPGQGKTHLAAAYLNQWMLERGRSGAFVSLVDLMASLRRTIRAENGPDWDTTLERYIEAELLVLDDLGQEKASEKIVEVVFHLLNSRINRGKPTVVTTNYSLKQLTADIGYPGSIASRLASFHLVAWASEDYRLRVVDLWERPE